MGKNVHNEGAIHKFELEFVILNFFPCKVWKYPCVCKERIYFTELTHTMWRFEESREELHLTSSAGQISSCSKISVFIQVLIR